jgi:hypothetical protein
MRLFSSPACASVSALLALMAAMVQAETPSLKITLASGSPIEQRKKAQIERLAAAYDLKKFTLTRDISIEQGGVAHSKPVLTLNGRFLDDDDRALSQYVHEQGHWVLGRRAPRDLRELYMELASTFPAIPTQYPQGSGGVQDSYFHLAVILLEWQALDEVIGPERARAVMVFKQGDHYTALYALVLEHRDRVEKVLKRYGVRW